MKTTATQYKADTLFDENGVVLLSMAVIERAFLDYIDYLKLLACISDPYRSNNTFRRYNKVFQKCAKIVKDRKRRLRKQGKYGASPEITYNQILDVITSFYYIYATRLLDTKDFMLNGRMKLFSEHINGEDIIKKAEKIADDWVSGKSAYKTINVGIWK